MRTELFPPPAFAALALCTTAIASPALAGTWTPLTHQPSFCAETALLLTDGGVLMHTCEGSDWWRLDPDLSGSYVNGTWRQVASLPSGYTPLYFASAVLPDGRVIVEGGEYNGGPAEWTSLGAIYNPARDTWTSVLPPAGWSNIGDGQSVVLANGSFMLANSRNTSQALFDASTLGWTVTGTGKADRNYEEGWTLLPSGNVLTIDTGNGTLSELYNPAAGGWTLAGNVGVSLANSDQEIGPTVLMTDGRVFAAGATMHTALYGTNGVWTPGPDYPFLATDGQMFAADAPAAPLPNGNVLIATSPVDFQPKVHFFEFNGASFTEAPRTPNAAHVPSYSERFLVLPTGQVLATDGSSDVEIYTASGSANPAWSPTIASVPLSLPQGHSYSISGTQFNGLSQGASYGDDAQMATNYPLVRVAIVDTGHVRYLKTHDHSTMAVATGSQPVSTTFDVPTFADPEEGGPASLQVIANGIASPAVNVCIPLTAAQACSAQCFGTSSDACGVTIGCPTLTGARCCTHMGGVWLGNRCV